MEPIEVMIYVRNELLPKKFFATSYRVDVAAGLFREPIDEDRLLRVLPPLISPEKEAWLDIQTLSCLECGKRTDQSVVRALWMKVGKEEWDAGVKSGHYKANETPVVAVWSERLWPSCGMGSRCFEENQKRAQDFDEGSLPAEDVASQVPLCPVCAQRALLKCSRCKTAWFCSETCAKKAWPEHKKVCKAVDVA